MRLSRRAFAVLILCFLFGVGIVYAREIQQGDECLIEEDRIVEGNLLVLCRSLIIEGRVTGSVIGVATSATISGAIDGDVYLLAGQLDIAGNIGDDLVFAGAVLRIHENADFLSDTSDLISLSLSTTVDERAAVPGNVLNVGYQLLLQGNVGGEVSFWGSSLLIAGDIQGDVDAQVGDATGDVTQLETLLIPIPLDVRLVEPGLRVRPGARIGGQLTYAGPTEGVIAEDTLARPPVYIPVVVQPDLTQLNLTEEDASLGFAIYLSQAVREFLTLTIVGILVLLVVPRAVKAPMRSIQARPLVCLGVGLLTFIISFVIIPFVVLFTFLLVVIVSLLQVNELTLAIGAILIVADIGLGAFIFFVVIFVSRVVFCLWLGRLLVRRFFTDDGSARIAFLSLLLGAGLLAIVASLPHIGWIVNAIVLFLGLGAILTVIQARTEAARDIPGAPKRRYNISVSPPQLPRAVGEQRVTAPPPPPIIDATARPTGMENLPEGFDLDWLDDK